MQGPKYRRRSGGSVEAADGSSVGVARAATTTPTGGRRRPAKDQTASDGGWETAGRRGREDSRGVKALTR